nr:RNA-binding domain-containing protein [Polymorphobacter megasporae]
MGVSDRGKLIGLDDARVLRDKIERWTADLISPPPMINPIIIDISGLNILVVEVANGTAPFYGYDGRFYARVGTSSVILDAAQLVDIVRGRRVEDVIASMESSLAVAQATATAAMYATAPAIMGQGDLATMSYFQVRDRVFSEIRLSPAFTALESGLAVAQSTASIALTSFGSVNFQREITEKYDTNLPRILDELENSPFIKIMQSAILGLQSMATVTQSQANSLHSEMAAIRSSLASLQSELSAVVSSRDINKVEIDSLSIKMMNLEVALNTLSFRVDRLQTI